MKEVYIWQDVTGWRHQLKGSTQIVAGFTSYEDAAESAKDTHGPFNVLPWDPSEKRSLSGKSQSKRPALETDGLCDTAPLQSDHSTIPPVYRVLNVELDLLPLLKDSVEEAIEKLGERIIDEYGTRDLSPYERKAVTAARSSRWEALKDLQKQVAA